MAIKFERKEEYSNMREFLQPLGASSRLAHMDPKHRLIIIYVGLFVFASLVIAYQGFMRQHETPKGPELTATGVIAEKRIDGFRRPVHVFEVELVLADGEKYRGTLRTDPESYQRLFPGDHMVVTYRRTSKTNRVQILKAELVAPPQSNE